MSFLVNPIQDLYSINSKMLMKEVEDDTDGKIYHILRLEE